MSCFKKYLLLLLITILYQSCKQTEQKEVGVFEFYSNGITHKVNNFRLYKSQLDNVFLAPDKQYFNLWEMPIDSMNYISYGNVFRSSRVKLNDKYGDFNLPIRNYDSIIDVYGTDVYGNRYLYLGQVKSLNFILENNEVLNIDKKGIINRILN